MVLIYPILSLALSESAVSQGQDAFLGALASVQSRRVEDQRAVGSVPVLCNSTRQTTLSQLMANADTSEPDDHFFDMLVKSQVSRSILSFYYFKKEIYITLYLPLYKKHLYSGSFLQVSNQLVIWQQGNAKHMQIQNKRF